MIQHYYDIECSVILCSCKSFGYIILFIIISMECYLYNFPKHYGYSMKWTVTVGRTLNFDLLGVRDRYLTCTNPHWFPSDNDIVLLQHVLETFFSHSIEFIQQPKRFFFSTLLFGLCVKRRWRWKYTKHYRFDNNNKTLHYNLSQFGHC